MKPSKNKERILTFDCYGTLLDTKPLYMLIAKTARKAGLDADLAVRVFSQWEDRVMYGQPFLPYDQLLLQVLQWCDWQLETDVFVRLYPEVLAVHENFQPFDDVIPSLKAFKAKGWKIGLMSNTTEKLMAAHRKALADLADLWLCADDTQCYKPDLRFFQQAQFRWNLADANHLHIAKGYWWDMIPAAAMNWRRIWINREQQPLNSSQPQPDLCVLGLNELANTDLADVFEDETGHPLD